jgi:hypothetical protein
MELFLNKNFSLPLIMQPTVQRNISLRLDILEAVNILILVFCVCDVTLSDGLVSAFWWTPVPTNSWTVLNVVLESAGEDQLDRSCENEEVLH